MEKVNNIYTLFIDESGVASLNHKGEVFVLSCILIKNDDIPIIQGYFKLLKREYFKNDCKTIHCTDLFERTYQAYRKLQVPVDRRNSFIARVVDTLKIVPFKSSIYYINKDRLRTKLRYKPYAGKKTTTFNFDLPYELLARQAILDFSLFLEKKKTTGEIIIESRQFNDQLFVGYFDNARKSKLKGNSTNPYAECARKRINSLSIANKNYSHTGLELADMGAYTMYRKKAGDSLHRMKLNIGFSNTINTVFKEKSYVQSAYNQKMIEITETEVKDVKPSKLI